MFQKKTKNTQHPKIEYTEYMYPLTLKKAKQSFMSYAENKGKLKFCVSAIVKKIAGFFERLLQLTFFLRMNVNLDYHQSISKDNPIWKTRCDF